jgi:hypothetical protein
VFLYRGGGRDWIQLVSNPRPSDLLLDFKIPHHVIFVGDNNNFSYKLHGNIYKGSGIKIWSHFSFAIIVGKKNTISFGIILPS